jgi:RluA family pseudouridine synthase
MQPIETLYEDDAIVAVNKPAGWTVIPARDEPAERCLRAIVESGRGEKLWVCHRIDRDTSGVVLFARTAEAHRVINAAFEARGVQKGYDAFVRSAAPLPQHGSITTPLHSARKGKMRPATAGEEGALPCETVWSKLCERTANGAVVSRLSVRPKTGRQHQIRVHFRSISAPLVVDSLYGGSESREAGALGEESPALGRLTLHASRVSLAHPTDASRAVVIEAPLPEDLSALDAWLRAKP